MDIITIIEKRGKLQKRTLKDLRDFLKQKNKKIADKILKKRDPIIYTVKEIAEDKISYAITKIHPGKIGTERYMTKGHYHKKSLPEVYILLKGKGEIHLKNKSGKRKKIRLKKGVFHYIPRGYAHRTVNSGNKDLEILAIYQTDSGHDYGSIKEKGF
jgi:glucose-6-phosphate isomerase